MIARCLLPIATLASACALPAAAQPHIANRDLNAGADHWDDFTQAAQRSGVDAGWRETAGRGGSGALHISVTDEHGGASHIWRTEITDLPPGMAFTVSAFARGSNVQSLVAVCLQGWDEDSRSVVDFATTQFDHPLRGDFDWTRIETTLTPSGRAESYFLLAFIEGQGDVHFDDFTIEFHEPRGASDELERPGLYEARGSSRLTVTAARSSPRIMMPLPLMHRGQVPLTWSFTADPPTAIDSITIRRDTLDNWVAFLSFDDLAPGAVVDLNWSSLVLAAHHDFGDVPDKAPLPDVWPEEARPWLASSWAVQSDDQRIIDAAARPAPAPDAIDIIDKTLAEAGVIMRKQTGRCDSLDAVQALEKQGSCTSCANLVCALLRANGLPTRILAGYPTWSGPLQTHYTVETWIPEYGWYPIESTLLRHPWQPHQQIQVAVVPVEYEDRSKGRACAAAGVPYLSLTEYVDYDQSYTHHGTLERQGCDHAAAAWQLFEAPSTEAEQKTWRRLEHLAQIRWRTWLEADPASDTGALATPLSPDDFMLVTTPEELLRTLQP